MGGGVDAGKGKEREGNTNGSKQRQNEMRFIQDLGFECLHQIDVYDCIRGPILGIEEVSFSKVELQKLDAT